MTDAATATRAVTVERELAHPPAKVWRALTQPHLIAEWLMASDFVPAIGHRFDFRADWGSVACEVRAIEPERSLVYSWAAMGLESEVTWTLVPSGRGTILRMKQTGFRTDQEQAYQGARHGWQRFFGSLEELLARID